MKKGFTLVELISVVVILGIILVIAIPRITDVIESAKINAVIKNEEMLVRATRNYLVSNDEKMPTEIGDTEEITLEELQNNDLISSIKSPFSNNNCNGYVLITKINDTNFDYTPHLKCGDNYEIGDSVSDRLIAHYKFNDFQEPTDNLVRNITISGHGSSWVNSTLTHNELPVYRNTVTNPSVGNNFGFRMGGSEVILQADGPKNITISFNNYIQISPGYTYGYVRVRYTDGTIQNHGWIYTDSSWFQKTDEWQKVVGVATLNSSKIPEAILIWYVYRDNAIVGDMYVSGIQVEQKAYDTNYTPDNRPGIIKDHSINNNNILLQIDSTPTWTIDGYSFINNNTYMTLPNNLITNADIRSNGVTYSAWIKPDSLSNQRIVGQQISIGYSDYSSGGLGISAGGNAQMIAYSDANPSAYIYAQGTTVLGTNAWNHIVGTFDPIDKLLRVYLNGDLDGPPLMVGVFSRLHNNVSNRIGIKHNPNSLPYKGKINNIVIYNRALTATEIKLMYNLSK